MHGGDDKKNILGVTELGFLKFHGRGRRTSTKYMPSNLVEPIRVIFLTFKYNVVKRQRWSDCEMFDHCPLGKPWRGGEHYFSRGGAGG